MTEVICIYGDSEYVCQQLSEKISEGWAVMDMQTNLYETTGGMRRDTTVYLIKATEA